MKILNKLFDCNLIKKRIKKGNINPLNCNIGKGFVFKEELDIKDYSFFLECITRYTIEKETTRTDYHLASKCPVTDQIIQLILRLEYDKDELNFQLLYVIEKTKLPIGFKNTKEFYIDVDIDGEHLNRPRKYWLTKKQIINLECISLKEENIIKKENSKVTNWQFSRETYDYFGKEIIEFICVNLNHKKNSYFVLRGSDIEISQVELA